jgi:hypothetical protein
MKAKGKYSGTGGDSGGSREYSGTSGQDREIFWYWRGQWRLERGTRIFRYHGQGREIFPDCSGQWRGGREYSGTIDRIGKYFGTRADSGEGVENIPVQWTGSGNIAVPERTVKKGNRRGLRVFRYNGQNKEIFRYQGGRIFTTREIQKNEENFQAFIIEERIFRYQGKI